ncbi:MAG: phytanoyl-CoA dioxygenase family protein [Pyrinomonadaceae bacterium]
MENGFEIIDGVISELECRQLLIELNKASRQEKRAGQRHLMSNEAVSRFANEDRFLKIAQKHLGNGAVPYRATLFDKSPRANWLVVWHQDTALPLTKRFESDDWVPWSVKKGIRYAHAPTWALEKIVALRVSLDDSTEENGPLRVISGSHKYGVLEDSEVLNIAHSETPVNCITKIGGVVAMRPLLIHAFSKSRNNKPRRVLHIEYASDLRLGDNIQLAIA